MNINTDKLLAELKKLEQEYDEQTGKTDFKIAQAIYSSMATYTAQIRYAIVSSMEE